MHLFAEVKISLKSKVLSVGFFFGREGEVKNLIDSGLFGHVDEGFAIVRVDFAAWKGQS